MASEADSDYFSKIEAEICDTFDSLISSLCERKSILLAELKSLREEFNKKNEAFLDKVKELEDSKLELESVAKTLKGNQAFEQMECAINELDKKLIEIKSNQPKPQTIFFSRPDVIQNMINSFGNIAISVEGDLEDISGHNGFVCPCCKSRIEKRTSMHIRCTQCPAEFCSGCSQLFKKENCIMFPSCAKKGLHAHHPRNCEYFTRDMEIANLKQLLERGGFQSDELQVVPQPKEGAVSLDLQTYQVKVPGTRRNAVIEIMRIRMGNNFLQPLQGELEIPCHIYEYDDDSKVICRRYSLEKDGYAGLCEKHYKTYLCSLIERAGLDPIDVLEVTEDNIYELFAILKRNEIPFDDKMKGDELKLLIKDKLPLHATKHS